MKKYRFSLKVVTILFMVTMTVAPLWAATLNVSKWTESASNPVFDPTEKTYYPCVIKISDTYQMYYADENSIRYTTSSDGINWSNGTEITFTTGPTPAKQNHPWVVYNGSEYKLWYWDSINSSTSKLYMATSSDGISWAEHSAISITSGMAYSFFYNARVIWNGTNYEGWFDNNGGEIEYANSGNSIDWETATPCVFNGYGGAFTPPCVVKLDDTYYMWFGYKAVDPEPNGYSNTGIGYANSSNGINWQIKFSPIFAINDSGATWRNYRSYTPNVIKEDNTWKIWFTGKSSDGNYAIGYAATNYWEPDYTIIQEAVDAANPGDTIDVAAGIYDITTTILLDKPLTLTGPQAGSDPRPSFGSTRITGDTWTEAVLDANGSIATLIDIRANNIVLDGLEVKGGTGDMIYSSSSYTTDSTVIKYSIIHDSFNYPLSPGDEGIQLKKAPNSLIEFNHIFRTYGDGINIASGSINGTIRSNEVHDIKSENGGIYVYDITDAIDYNTTIIGNLVYNCADEGINFGHKGGSDETD
ncbi:MAG: right-handed parallel beta-helix repeat-containing protein, partial [Bacteroidales bacterium]|nr:right-handed parallel beta-helix repeat-containing protein [Bacteroidales bacterium]